MHKLLKMVSGAQLLSLYTYHHETSHADFPWGKDVPYRFWGPKVKVTMHKLLKMVSGAQLLSLYTYHHETSHADSPWGKDVPYRFWGQKVEGQGHNA